MSPDSSPSLPIQNDTPLTHTPENTADGNATPTQEPIPPLTRSNRPLRACTIRVSQRLYAQQQQAENERRQKQVKKDQKHNNNNHQQQKQPKEEDDGSSSPEKQCCSNSKIVTQLGSPSEPSQLPRWTIRSMWELASVLNSFNVFRPLLNVFWFSIKSKWSRGCSGED